MIIRKKEISITLPHDKLETMLNLSLRDRETITGATIPLERFLWFDIETTGLSARHCPLYLIGCVRREQRRFVRYQFMTESVDDEPAVLSAFLDLCREADCLVQFNGDTFDVPYVRERCRIYGLPDLHTGLC